MTTPRILVLPGSARKDSFNRKLAAVAADCARAADAEVTLINPADYPMPIYDGDCESDQGVPEHARRLTDELVSHDALILVCPEYNSSITPLLKNIIDWTSRPQPDRPGLVGWTGKCAALLAASPGALGGLRGLVHVRAILSNIGVHVIPQQFALSRAHDAFNPDGSLKDEAQAKTVDNIAAALVRTAAALKSAS